jgi:pyrimidine deaminase RibD-like protein
MQMHSASGYLLTGVIVPTEFSALYVVDLDDEEPRGESAVGAADKMGPAANAALDSGALVGGAVASSSASADLVHMNSACDLAFRCEPVTSAYNVGAVLVDSAGRVVSTGFSRELEGNTHAEEVCLLKPGGCAAARGGTIYSTMEPCGLRLSGKLGCAQRLVEAGVARVVLAVAEPPNFVQKCEGADLLRAAGIRVDVIADAGCRQRALDANAHLTNVGGQ